MDSTFTNENTMTQFKKNMKVHGSKYIYFLKNNTPLS